MNPSFSTTRLGFAPFDKAFGGIYFNRPVLIHGPRNTGKSILAAQFTAKVLRTGESICVMSDSRPDDFLLELQSLKVDIHASLESGQLLPISVRQFSASGATSETLPFPAALDELKSLAKSRSISFFVFNTVLPWVAVPGDQIDARVDAFLSTLADLSLTSILLLPRPVSPLAKRLQKALADRCPIVFEMHPGQDANRLLQLTRYQGSSGKTLPVGYQVTVAPGRGLIPRCEAALPAPATTADNQPPRRRRHRALVDPAGISASASLIEPLAQQGK